MSEETLGVFAQLTNYGALGIIVIALGYASWYFLKKNMDEKERLQKIIEEKLKNNN